MIDSKILLKLVLILGLGLSFSSVLQAYNINIECEFNETCVNEALFKRYLINRIENTKNIDTSIFNTADFFVLNILEKIVEPDNIYIKLQKKRLINKIIINGNKHFSRSTILNQINVITDRDYFENLNRKIISDLTLFYSSNGFINTLVELKVISKNNKNILSINIKEGEKLVLKNIEINVIGNLSKKRIIQIMELNKDFISRDIFNKGLRNLNKYLFDNRYYAKRISKSDFEVAANKVSINLELELGPKIYFIIDGLNIIETYSALLDILNIYETSILNLGFYDNLKNNLLKHYNDNGYIDANIEVYDKVRFGNNALNIIFKINENNKSFIKDININTRNKELNVNIKQEILAKHSGIFKTFNKEKINEINNVIKDYLESLGYLNVKIFPVRYDKYKDNFYIVNFNLDEGIRAKIRKVKISGITFFEDNEINKLINIKEDTYFLINELRQSIANLRLIYVQNGFSSIKIQNENLINISKDLRFVDINLEVKEGEQYYFGDFFITGNSKTKNKVILRELEFNPNDIFDYTKLLNAEKNISSIGLFSEVNLVVIDRENRLKDVLIKVVEKNQGIYELGVGYKTDEGFNLSSNISYSNIDGLNSRLNLDAVVSSKYTESNYNFLEYNLGVSYFLPYFLDFPFDFRISSQLRKEDFIYYGQEKLNFAVNLEKKYIKHRLILRNAIENIDFIQIEDIDLDPNYWKYSIRQSYYYDARNSIFNPTSGFYLNVFVEYGRSFAGQETNNYIKAVDRIRNYFELNKGLVFYSTFNFGLLYALYGDKLLLDERFVLGGIDSIRGYKRNFINTYENDDINRQWFYTASFELRQDLVMNLIGVFFIDAGDLNSSIDKFKKPYLSSGLGLRINFEVAYLSFEYAYILNKDTAIKTEDKGRFHLSIGAY